MQADENEETVVIFEIMHHNFDFCLEFIVDTVVCSGCVVYRDVSVRHSDDPVGERSNARWRC